MKEVIFVGINVKFTFWSKQHKTSDCVCWFLLAVCAGEAALELSADLNASCVSVPRASAPDSQKLQQVRDQLASCFDGFSQWHIYRKMGIVPVFLRGNQYLELWLGMWFITCSCAYVCVCPVHKNAPKVWQENFSFPLVTMAAHLYGGLCTQVARALAPFSCVRSQRALRILSRDILELWLSLCVHTGKILPLTHVSYLGHSSVLFSAPTFRERSMQEPVSFHLPLYPALLWWLVLMRLILAFGIITCPVVSN